MQLLLLRVRDTTARLVRTHIGARQVMKSNSLTAVLVLIVGFQECVVFSEQSDKTKVESSQPDIIVKGEAQLFDNMGPYQRKFTTDSETAQNT